VPRTEKGVPDRGRAGRAPTGTQRSAGPQLHLSGDPEADELLSEDPLALLIGMVLDQQIPLERAFSAPRDLRQRLGGRLDAAAIATMSPDRLAAVFAERPALHRFPASNAERVQKLAQSVIEDYGGDASAIWAEARDGDELLRRLKALPGFGEQKAKIFIALLGKQFGVRPPGWQEASKPFGEPGTYLSVADITDASSLARVRAHKAEMKRAAKALDQALGPRAGPTRRGAQKGPASARPKRVAGRS
jgi:uncharacterized HhH-GPD family protein